MKTKDAQRIGIMIATTAMEQYKEIVERLKEIIRRANKLYYVFYVGKLNPAKLANFPEIDVFVLVASPENTCSVDASKRLAVPVPAPRSCCCACLSLSVGKLRESVGSDEGGSSAAEYYRPLITPMELETALVKGKTWTGDYNLDFRPLL